MSSIQPAMSTKGGKQPLISQWVRKPLGTKSSIAVNSNGVNIKRKTGAVVNKSNKAMVSTIVQNENIDISTLCNVVKVSGPRKVVPSTSSQNVLEMNRKSALSGVT